VTPETWSVAGEPIIKRNLQAIGIKLDIQNVPDYNVFYGTFLTGGKASPPTGAVAGRYDIAELEYLNGYDPDDSSLLSCDQISVNGGNIDFYCNPALDALYQQELTTLDPGLRQQAFIKIHLVYLTDLPFIVLYSPSEVYMVRKGTHNYSPSPTGTGETINIWEWWCDNGKC
jgi:peptide/nickel transport system substrate-binding protein